MNDYLRTGDIDVENGGLHIADTSNFGATGGIQLKEGSEFIVEGSVNVARIKLASNSSLVLDGSLVAEQLEAEDSVITVHDTDEPVRIEKRFKLSGDSEVQFVIADEEWGSTFELATRRAKPQFSGVMRLEFTPDFDPRQLQGKTINLFDWVDGAQPSTEFAQILHPTRVQLDLSTLYTHGNISVTSVLDEPKTAGDFNDDSLLDILDINSLSARIHNSLIGFMLSRSPRRILKKFGEHDVIPIRATNPTCTFGLPDST